MEQLPYCQLDLISAPNTSEAPVHMSAVADDSYEPKRPCTGWLVVNSATAIAGTQRVRWFHEHPT